MSGSKLDENAVHGIKVITYKLVCQLCEKRDLLCVKASVIEIITIRDFNAPTITAPNRFKRVGTKALRINQIMEEAKDNEEQMEEEEPQYGTGYGVSAPCAGGHSTAHAA